MFRWVWLAGSLAVGCETVDPLLRQLGRVCTEHPRPALCLHSEHSGIVVVDQEGNSPVKPYGAAELALAPPALLLVVVQLALLQLKEPPVPTAAILASLLQVALPGLQVAVEGGRSTRNLEGGSGWGE